MFTLPISLDGLDLGSIDRRRDIATHRWCKIVPTEIPPLLANHRAKLLKEPAPDSYHANCPACPGNEHLTNQVICQRHVSDTIIRVTTSKNQKCSIKTPQKNVGHGMHDHANEYGADEMVVIGEKHSMSIAELPLDILTESLYVCSERMIDLARDPNLISMIVRTGWNNDDREAGMTHPLWHIHASDIVYQRPKEEMDCCTHYYLRLDKERCLFCDMIRQELETSERTIWETEHFLVMAPFASRYTFETWIIPKSHHANFECLAGTANYGQVIPELASLIQRVMKNLEALLGPRFAYTAMLYNAPQKFNTCKREDIPLLYHWRVRIAPRFIEQSSEEDATGMSIIKLFPEHAAIILRQTPDEIRDWLSASI